MYGKVNAQNGIEILYNFLSQQDIQTGPDGLVFAPPSGQFGKDVYIPDRLMNWLLDLRLLRHVPLTYLVPDRALLPTESIRFFHIDPTWIDRMVDGIFSAANTGTVDIVFSCEILALARGALDKQLEELAKSKVAGNTWTADKEMTGMLIRSELVHRWPDMIVQAYSGATPVPIMRAETLSRDIYIAVFAGKPTKITIQEPFSGVRFGVEPTKVANPPQSEPYQVDARDGAGENIPDNGENKRVTIPFRNAGQRVINVAILADRCQSAKIGLEKSSRQVALDLEQRPYVQEFKDTVAEPEGSEELPVADTVTLRHNRIMNLASLKSRALQQVKAGA